MINECVLVLPGDILCLEREFSAENTVCLTMGQKNGCMNKSGSGRRKAGRKQGKRSEGKDAP